MQQDVDLISMMTAIRRLKRWPRRSQAMAVISSKHPEGRSGP